MLMHSMDLSCTEEPAMELFMNLPTMNIYIYIYMDVYGHAWTDGLNQIPSYIYKCMDWSRSLIRRIGVCMHGLMELDTC